MIAGDIMDLSAVLMNDKQKQQYTYIAQLPFLQMAMKELREIFELNNISVTNETSAVLTITAGVTIVSYSTTPALPAGLVEIQRLWERQSGVDPFVPVERKEFLPHYLEGDDRNYFSYYEWSGEQIKLLASNRDNDLKIDYVKDLFTTVFDENSTILVTNVGSFLHYRTAGLCAEFIAENKTRADSLNSDAMLALERSLGISNKGKQAIATRHRPFRASYKAKGF